MATVSKPIWTVRNIREIGKTVRFMEKANSWNPMEADIKDSICKMFDMERAWLSTQMVQSMKETFKMANRTVLGRSK